MPDVPVSVTEAVPVVALLLAVSVSWLVLVAGFGLNDAVTPLGRPVAESVTLPVKPAWGVIVIVLVLLDPRVRFMLPGDADNAKPGVEGASVSATLSKVAVASAEFCPLLTANPTWTVAVIVMVRGVPICTQLTPSDEAAAVKVDPLRVILTQ